MNNYSFKDINNIYVIGDCHGEFKTYLHYIKQGLFVNSEDEDTPHPKEIERLERKEAREHAAREQAEQMGYHGLFERREGRPYLRFGAPTTTGMSNAYKKSKRSNKGIYSNSLFIIAGDCGIGYNKKKYYDDIFEKFNKILSYNNSFIIFIRGNHDDPEYFNGESINLSNIKAVPDYSVISVCNKNILCVGGAISLDRTWRVKQEERINRFSSNKKTIYWKNEAPIFDKNLLNEAIKSFKIDYVISHSAPSFVSTEKFGIEEWLENDKNLLSDITEERKVLDKVFETLRDNNMKPFYWAYGHFDANFIEKRSDTIFRGLGGGFKPISIERDIISFKQNEVLQKLKEKTKKNAKTINPIESPLNDFMEQFDAYDIGEADNREEEEFVVDPMFGANGVEPIAANEANDNNNAPVFGDDNGVDNPVGGDEPIAANETNNNNATIGRAAITDEDRNRINEYIERINNEIERHNALNGRNGINIGQATTGADNLRADYGFNDTGMYFTFGNNFTINADVSITH